MIKLVSTVGFIIVNKENKILLIKRCEEKNQQGLEKDKIELPKDRQEEAIVDEWMIPTGNLDENDDARDVIKREVKRCLNCELKECTYFNLYFYSISDSFIKKASYFYGTIEGKIRTKTDFFSAEWISLNKDEIDKLNLIPEQKEALSDFLVFYKDKCLNKLV